MRQITNTIVMVRPVSFRKNEETAINNFFQEDLMLDNEVINTKAQEEFDAFVVALRAKGVTVIVVQDTKEPNTPDAIFPNNWVSFHANGTVALYPMFAKNRRLERKETVIDAIEAHGFVIKDIMDYTEAEDVGVFLEGTGSILLDRVHKKAYCALSPRANEELFIEFCEDFDYMPVLFTAYQQVENKRVPIYHTNVMMALGENIAIICLDSIDDKKEKKNVVDHLKESGKEIITITEQQLHQFAGNMLEVLGAKDQPYLVMSSAAYHSLTSEQLKAIEKQVPILHSSLKTIETCGGGSARCMMAEVFLPKQ